MTSRDGRSSNLYKGRFTVLRKESVFTSNLNRCRFNSSCLAGYFQAYLNPFLIIWGLKLLNCFANYFILFKLLIISSGQRKFQTQKKSWWKPN